MEESSTQDDVGRETSPTEPAELTLRVESLDLTVVRPATEVGEEKSESKVGGDSLLEQHCSESSVKCRLRARLVSDAGIAWKVNNGDSDCTALESKR
jgi:hypothetical protein